MPRLLEGQAPAGLWDGLAAQVSGEGFVLADAVDASSIWGANGVTIYDTKQVLVRADMNDAARVKTLAHELGHVRMHDPADSVTHHRGIREVDAESVAMMIGAAHGMDTTGYTIPYVASWAEAVPDKEPVDVVRDTGERVRKIALDILDKLPDTSIGDGYPPGLDRNGPDASRNHTPAREEAGASRAEELGNPIPVSKAASVDVAVPAL